MSQPWAVVLAAGQGTRMMGRTHKLARLWSVAPRPSGGEGAGGEGSGTVLAATLRTLSEAGWPTIVVLGEPHPTLVQSAHEASATVAYNEQYSGGVGGSIATGVRALPDGVPAVMIVLGDMPRVPRGHYTAMREAWLTGAGIAVTAGEEVSGPPALFDARYRAELEALEGDQGARTVWRAHPRAVVEVRADRAWLRDIDVAEDLTGR